MSTSVSFTAVIRVWYGYLETPDTYGYVEVQVVRIRPSFNFLEGRAYGEMDSPRPTDVRHSNVRVGRCSCRRGCRLPVMVSSWRMQTGPKGCGAPVLIKTRRGSHFRQPLLSIFPSASTHPTYHPTHNDHLSCVGYSVTATISSKR